MSDADSFAMTRRLAREEALLVGGSCGMAAVAAIRLAEELNDPEAVVVVLLPDSAGVTWARSSTTPGSAAMGSRRGGPPNG